MKHQLSGMQKAVQSHVRSCSVHQRAWALFPLARTKNFDKKTVDQIAGFYLRAFESVERLADVGRDVLAAKMILDGTAQPDQPVIGQFSEQAQATKTASAETKAACVVALDTLLASINDTLKSLEPILSDTLVDAKSTLVKFAASDALDTKSLLRRGGAGLQLVEGTLVHRHLPAVLLTGRGGLTAQGEKTLADSVMKDYLRELEEQKMLDDEYADADRRAAQNALKQRAVAALNNLGVD